MTTQPDSLAVRVFEVAIRADPEVAVGPGEIDDPGRNRIPARRRHDRHLRLPHENFLQIAFARWPAMLDDDDRGRQIVRERGEHGAEGLHAAGGTRNGDEPRFLVARNQPPISSRTASRSDQAIRLV
jgi:hypothetical protein